MMQDSSADLADYRARLQAALDAQVPIAQPNGGTVTPPRMGPPGQSDPRDPDNPWSTPDQGGMPDATLGAPEDPPQQGQGPQAGDQGVEVSDDPQDPNAPQSLPTTRMAPTIDGQGAGEGAGPSIDQGPPPAAQSSLRAPQGAYGYAPGGIDTAPQSTLDQVMPNPVGAGPGSAPNAPTAPEAPNVPNAPLAPRAKRAPNAPNAPTLDGGGNAATPIDDGGAANIAPAAAHTNGETTPDGKKGIDVHPPGFNPDDPSNYKKGAIADLQKTTPDPKPSDIFDAMKPKVQSKYMDWWEKQHGDIEQRYDQLQQQLGQRPDPNRDPTRKERFQTLMDFGISLLQHSGRNGGAYGSDANGVAATGDALHDAFGAQKQRQLNDTANYDAQSQKIQAAKQADLKDIGNYGQATREDASINLDMTRQAVAEMNALKPPKASQPTTRQLADGTQVDYDQATGTWNPSVDKNGKPIGKVMEGSTGKGGSLKQSAVVQQVNDMVAHGVSYETALSTVYHVKPGMDPRKTYQAVYNTERKAGAEPDDAKATAQQMTDQLHGQGAIPRAAAHDASTMIPTNTPPLNTLAEGKVTTYQNGQRWSLVNGQPKQVQ